VVGTEVPPWLFTMAIPYCCAQDQRPLDIVSGLVAGGIEGHRWGPVDNKDAVVGDVYQI